MAENKKKLRPPTKKERLKGLPKSRAAAIKLGLTRYIRDGEEWVIRNYGSKTAPQGRDTLAWKRKASRGGGSQGSRKEYETLSTPPEARTGKARGDFGRAMVEARRKGLVGDHRFSVARTGNALKMMSPARQALYHKRFKDAGIAIGNQAGNIDEVTEAVNYAKVGEEKRLDKVLQQMEARRNGNDNGNGNGKVNGKKNGKLNGSVLGATGKARTLDTVANIGMNVATGSYGAAGLGVGAIGMTAALQNRQTQKALGKQIGKLMSKRAGRIAMKSVPGFDIFLSGQEALQRLKAGQLGQAGIAALSGAIGWVPLIGDGISASLDLSNTAIDISQLRLPKGTSKKKGVIRPKSPTRRLKFDI